MMSMADIKHHIKIVKQTSQITRAMYMLSTNRVKRAVERIGLYRTYLIRIREAMKEIMERTEDLSHRYFTHREGGRAAYIVIAADKGMAGGFNNNVLKFAMNRIKQREQAYILTIGHIANDYFESRGFMVDVEFQHIAQNPTLYNARALVDDILQMYDNGLMDEVYVIFTRYDSTSKQYPVEVKLLPVELYEFDDVLHTEETENIAHMLYDPSAREVFEDLVPQFLIGIMFGAMLQSYVSEHTSRLHAMENATKSADDMIDKLTLQYNQARQYAITQEISEIVGAVELLSSRRPEYV